MESDIIHERRQSLDASYYGSEDAWYLGVFIDEHQGIGHIAVPYKSVGKWVT